MNPGSIPGNAFPKMERKRGDCMNYKFKILHSKNVGYALFKWNDESLFWEQYTKWYTYLGNLVRFNPDVRNSSYYSLVKYKEE